MKIVGKRPSLMGIGSIKHDKKNSLIIVIIINN
jgi:hypothetical protein